jgi:hypothetical protein
VSAAPAVPGSSNGSGAGADDDRDPASDVPMRDAADEAIARHLAAKAREAAAHGEPDTPMWLSHHLPGDYDRCAVVGGMHVCRRCLVLYPLALVAGVAISIGSWWPHGLDPWVLWLFPLPGVIEFVLDNLGRIGYSPVRQMVLTAGGAVAAGVGYVRYLDHSTDVLVWSVLATYVAICLAGAVYGGLKRGRA